MKLEGQKQSASTAESNVPDYDFTAAEINLAVVPSVLQVSLLTVTSVYYVYYIYHSVIILEVVELLQRHNYRGHVDVSLLATWEQVRERERERDMKINI